MSTRRPTGQMPDSHRNPRGVRSTRPDPTRRGGSGLSTNYLFVVVDGCGSEIIIATVCNARTGRR